MKVIFIGKREIYGNLETLVQVLGRQVALGEDEEAPEDPGAVGE